MTEVTIYTAGGSVTYILRDTTDNFADDLAQALAEGSVIKANTADGSLLVINPINAAAIEIRAVNEDADADEDVGSDADEDVGSAD